MSAILAEQITEKELLAKVVNHVGIITLNRPKALNALSHAMIIAMTEQLHAWIDDPSVHAVLVRGAGTKAFCAGGDIRALYQSWHRQTPLHREFFEDEYRLDYLTHHFPKPYVALMDGIVMGGGMGISQGAALRIVTERTRLAMPETGIGLIPDVGASYFLGKMPVGLALYLGLVGEAIGAADALFCGLADVYAESAALENLEQVLEDVRWHGDPLRALRTALAGVHAADASQAPVAASLPAVLPAIERHFAAESVAAIMASLAGERDPAFEAWAQRTLKLMQARSPLMLGVARRQLLGGRGMSLADCLRREIGLVRHCFERGDFIEGVRALIVDKDNAPRWKPARIEDVSEGLIDRFFESPWGLEEHPLRGLRIPD